MLTNERAEQIAKYLTADKERAQVLLALSPEEALGRINADGYDFTIEEITEFGKQLKVAATMQEGELDETALNGVSGGIVVEGVAIACISLGYAIGSALAKNYGW